MSPGRIAIVGGGVSGLATAYYLNRLGLESVLIEKSPRLGGLIQTNEAAGCLLEAGPDSFLSTKPAVADLARELGDLGELISSNDAVRRVYVVRSGKLVPLPAGMTMMVPGRLLPALRSELFSPSTKLGFLRERLFPPRTRPDDISLGELVTEHFGREVLEYVAEPLLAGVYGGDASRLSAASVLPRFVAYERDFGSLIRGVQQENAGQPKGSLFRSFRDGMQSFTASLARAISHATPIIHAEALSVERGEGAWHVKLSGDSQITAEHVVLATPAHAAARLLETAAPSLATELASIPYSSSILVNVLYDSRDVRHPLHGFGFLVPQRERRTVAAATWVHRKFPQRIAPGMSAFRGFLVGDEAVRLRSASDSELIDLVRRDFQLMGITAAPRLATVHRWPHSMPQYTVGHQQRCRNIAQLLVSSPSLYLVGNAFEGVGIPDCVRLAQAVATRIHQGNNKD